MAAALALMASAYYDTCGANSTGRDVLLETGVRQPELCHHRHSPAPMAAILASMDSAHHDACSANGKGRHVPLEVEFQQHHRLHDWKKTSCV